MKSASEPTRRSLPNFWTLCATNDTLKVKMPQRKLLVADDSLTIQKVIRLALSSSAASGGDSYEIQTVSDGDGALQQLSLFRPDIILVDVNLPKKSAVELKTEVDALGTEFSNLRFVLLSSAFEKLDESSIERAGFQFRLSKPFDPAHLRQVLASVGATLAGPLSTDSVTAGPPVLAMDIKKGDELTTDFPPPAPFNRTTIPLEIALEPPNVKASIQVEGTSSRSNPKLDSNSSSQSDGHGFDSDEDIRRLTQETLKNVASFDALSEQTPLASAGPINSISPLDWSSHSETLVQESDSEWSVHEHAAIPPPPVPASFQNALTPDREMESAPPRLAPLDSDLLSDFGDSDFPLIRDIRRSSQPQNTESRLSISPDGVSLDSRSATVDLGIRGFSPNSNPLPPPPIQQELGVAPLSVDQMEAILARQLEASIQEMARKLLPDLAERIIKEEIHRMLQQQP
jgi:CheY-like chemotaxis protein